MNSSNGYPMAPGNLPLVGHVVPLLRDPLKFLRSLTAFKDLVKIRFGHLEAVVVCDPELTSKMLRDNRTFDRSGPLFDAVIEVVGENVGTCTRDQHLRQRRLLQPAFHPSRMPGYAAQMNEQIDAVLQSWRAGQVVNVAATMHHLATRVLFTTMFGSGITDTAPLSEIIDDARVMMRGSGTRTMVPFIDRIPTPERRRFRRAYSRSLQHVDGIVENHLAGKGDKDSLISILLSGHSDQAAAGGCDGQQLSATEVKDNIRGFVIAGVDTTANTLSWALHLLSQHPHIQRELHREVDAVLDGRHPVASDVPSLRQVGNVITEALRLYPPGWIITRITSVDTELNGHLIPAGTTTVYSPYLIHHRPDLYPNPEQFDPHRWNDSDPSTLYRQGAFVPFGGGPHRCIGEGFALTEATLVLATILSRWQLHPVPTAPVRPSAGVVLRPRKLRLRLTARDRRSDGRQPLNAQSDDVGIRIKT